MIRAVGKLILFLLSLLILIVAGLLYTRPGLQFSLWLSSELTDQHLTVEQAKGRLAGPIRLKGIRFTHETGEVYVGQLYLDWSPMSLLKGQLIIKQIRIGETIYKALPSDKPAAPEAAATDDATTDFSIPLTVKLQHLAINNTFLQFAPEQPPIIIDHIKAKASANQRGFDANLIWDKILVPIKPDNDLIIRHGQTMLNGMPQTYRLLAAWETLAVEAPDIRWQLQGQGSLTAFTLDALTMHLLTGQLTTQGQISWQPALNWDLTVLGENIKPASNTLLDFKLASQGILSDQTQQATLTIDNIKGHVDQFPVKGQGNIRFKDDNLTIKALNIELGKSHIMAQGEINQQWHLDWQIDLVNLNSILAEAQGSVHSKGHISGPRLAPHIVADTEIKALEYLDFKIKQLNSTLNVNLDQLAESTANIQAQDIDLKTLVLDKFTMAVKGDQKQQALTLQFSHQQELFEIALHGQLEQQIWQGQLDKLRIATSQIGLWQTRTASQLLLSEQHIKVAPICLISSPGQLCISGEWSKTKGWQAKLALTKLPIATLTQLATPDIQAAGTIDLQLNAQQALNGPISADAKLNVSAGNLRLSVTDEEPQILPFQGASVNAQLDSKGLNAQIRLQIPNQPVATASLSLPHFDPQDFDPATQALNGSIRLQLTNLQFIAPLLPKLRNIQGNVDSQFQLAGTIKQPDIKGSARLSQGNVDIPALGITLANINFTANSQDLNTLVYQGQVNSGPGQMHLNGKTQLSQPGYPTDLSIKGNMFEVMNTLQGNIFASPDLTLTTAPNKIVLDGSIDIPKAKITPKDFSTTLNLSDDIVYINNGAAQKKDITDFYSTIKVSLGDEVLLDFMGLKAQLRGSINLHDQPGSATTAIGELGITNGKFTAYGQNLSIDQGDLIFTGGPVSNPGLRIRAYRTISSLSQVSNAGDGPSVSANSMRVGVDVSGSVNEPLLTLYSEPGGLSQSEILSYLVLGRSQSDSGGEAQLLLQALQGLKLGGDQENSITNQIQKGLGVNVGIESGEVYDADSQSVVDNTSLVLGKALSPRLFVNYSLGLIEPINILRISYKLTENWTLQTEASAESSGIDLFYSIELD